MTTRLHGVDLITKERSRQIKQLGYSREGDLGYADYLTEQAANQMRKAFDILMVDTRSQSDAVDNLVKAGALLAAAIDAIRLEEKEREDVTANEEVRSPSEIC